VKKLLTSKIRILGRAIPLWAIMSFVAVVALAGYFATLFTAQVNILMAPTSGPVVVTLKGQSDNVGPSCVVTADPESYGTTCDVVYNVGETTHTLNITDGYPGVEVRVTLTLANVDTEGFGSVFGQVVDTNGLPATIKYSEDIGDANRICGLELPPADGVVPASTDATEKWGYYRIAILDGFDGSPFQIDMEFDKTDPNGACPSSY